MVLLTALSTKWKGKHYLSHTAFSISPTYTGKDVLLKWKKWSQHSLSIITLPFVSVWISTSQKRSPPFELSLKDYILGGIKHLLTAHPPLNQSSAALPWVSKMSCSVCTPSLNDVPSSCYCTLYRTSLCAAFIYLKVLQLEDNYPTTQS